MDDFTLTSRVSVGYGGGGGGNPWTAGNATGFGFGRGEATGYCDGECRGFGIIDETSNCLGYGSIFDDPSYISSIAYYDSDD